MHASTHAYLHKYLHAYIYIYIYIYIFIYLLIYLYQHTHTQRHTHTQAHANVRSHAHAHTFACLHACLHILTNIVESTLGNVYVHRHAKGRNNTDRLRGMQAARCATGLAWPEHTADEYMCRYEHYRYKLKQMLSDGTNTETEYALYSHMCIDAQLPMQVTVIRMV